MEADDDLNPWTARARRRYGVDPLAQLAASVLAKETTEIPWRLLRQVYFTEKWEKAAERHLRQWADRYGITIGVENRQTPSVGWITFQVPEEASERRVRRGPLPHD